MVDKNTPTNLALLVLRLVAGLILFYYGSQKLLGWFGGAGLNETLAMFQKGMGIPSWATVLAIIAEFFGGLGLVVGLLTRMAAFGAMVTMMVAFAVQVKGVTTLVATKQNMFPIKDATYPLLIAAICLAIMALGAGEWSFDSKFLRKRRT
ncbi:MAG: DoxX family protein [Chthonomonas sp.]|nr:DoxX family protein [Chthonomonas sp.]